MKYSKWFARDFCLALNEIWGLAEAVDDKVWTTNKQPFTPYIVFENTGEVVNCYMSDEGYDWVVAETKSLATPEYIRKTITDFIASLDPIQEWMDNEATLNREDLVFFLKQLRVCWNWFEPIWWLHGVAEGEDLELVNKARARTENTGHGSDHVIRKSLASIYPHLASYVDVIRMDEIINEDFPSVEVLEKRQKGYIWVWGKLLDCSLEDVEKEYDIEIERLMVPRDSKEFTGMVACKGFARGRVRKIFKREQVGDVQEGEILVTSMTVPDFLPAMKKAAAFVTDEGGIVCHAVIIAREMGKPCIIGTKIATEMLRNGHEVEVDADNGVVRKV